MKNYFILVTFLAVVVNGCAFMGDALKGVGNAFEKKGQRKDSNEKSVCSGCSLTGDILKGIGGAFEKEGRRREHKKDAKNEQSAQKEQQLQPLPKRKNQQLEPNKSKIRKKAKRLRKNK